MSLSLEEYVEKCHKRFHQLLGYLIVKYVDLGKTLEDSGYREQLNSYSATEMANFVNSSVGWAVYYRIVSIMNSDETIEEKQKENDIRKINILFEKYRNV